MKKLNVMLLAVAFAITSFANANTEPKNTTTSTNLTEEIKELLKKPAFKVDAEETAYVTFTLNQNQEIVVLSVDSENASIENFIKSRLNYQKVSSGLGDDIKFYRMPVRVVES